MENCLEWEIWLQLSAWFAVFAWVATWFSGEVSCMGAIKTVTVGHLELFMTMYVVIQYHHVMYAW